jgi:erythromycin esterase-like protein
VAHPVRGAVTDFQPIMEMVADAQFVLLGEATHGSHEFYAARAEITQRLIERRGFTGICVEADWPDAYRVNRYVRGLGGDEEAVESLGDFKRFPTWMWRNSQMLEFIGWLREFNDERPPRDRVGFYGMDMYSLHSSMGAVIRYLDRVDPDAGRRARDRYGCFEHAGPDPQVYGYQAMLGLAPDCENEVVAVLTELRRNAMEYLTRDGLVADDELFSAQQNARLARSAERYYRQMYHAAVSSWNMRDQHMTETLMALHEHQHRQRGEARLVVWAHNSHLGDARATSMAQRGEWNVGQLLRERRKGQVLIVGFTTYDGSVSATSNWDAPVERKRIRPALDDSYEELFHRVGVPNFILNLRDDAPTAQTLEGPMLQRAIGVIYLPQTELASHYYHAHLSRQFDALIHYDHTRAVEPLERTSLWTRGEEETYPTGL